MAKVYRNHSTDHNQREIALALRRMGCTVQDTSAVAGGFPDLVVGIRGVNLLMEVKRADRSGAALTEAQKAWHATWGGHVCVVSTPSEAIEEVLLAIQERA